MGASYTFRWTNDIACSSERHFTCHKTMNVGEFYMEGVNTCTCTPYGIDCAPTYTCTHNENTLNPGEVVFENEQRCECTEDGFQCEDLTECPEFIRMDEKKSYADAKAACAEIGGFVSFFKDESEYEKYMSQDDLRTEWLGYERQAEGNFVSLGAENVNSVWKTADGSSDFFTQWISTEPNMNMLYGGCADIIMSSSWNYGKMADNNCNFRQHFSCRVSARTRGTCS